MEGQFTPRCERGGFTALQYSSSSIRQRCWSNIQSRSPFSNTRPRSLLERVEHRVLLNTLYVLDQELIQFLYSVAIRQLRPLNELPGSKSRQ